MAFQEIVALIMGVFPQYKLEEIWNQPIERFFSLMDMAAYKEYGIPIPSRTKKVESRKFLSIEDFDRTHKYDPVQGWVKWQ